MLKIADEGWAEQLLLLNDFLYLTYGFATPSLAAQAWVDRTLSKTPFQYCDAWHHWWRATAFWSWLACGSAENSSSWGDLCPRFMAHTAFRCELDHRRQSRQEACGHEGFDDAKRWCCDGYPQQPHYQAELEDKIRLNLHVARIATRWAHLPMAHSRYSIIRMAWNIMRAFLHVGAGNHCLRAVTMSDCDFTANYGGCWDEGSRPLNTCSLSVSS